jgi:hypothetical protein
LLALKVKLSGDAETEAFTETGLINTDAIAVSPFESTTEMV